MSNQLREINEQVRQGSQPENLKFGLHIDQMVSKNGATSAQTYYQAMHQEQKN